MGGQEISGGSNPSLLLGRPVKRLEDESLLRGADRYTGDLAVPGVLHAQFVRSTEAHALVSRVDVSQAELMPGVVGVFQATDVPIDRVMMPGLAAMLPDEVHRPALARDQVRFVGEIVAVVVADTLAAAADAAELVDVDYAPLEVAIDREAAAMPDSALLFPSLGTNVVFDAIMELGDAPAEPGETPEGLADTVTVRSRTVLPRMAVAPMEGNSIVAVPDASSGRTTAYLSSQYPHAIRDTISSFLGLDPAELRVVCPAVGGGFGGKIPTEVEYTVVVALARKLGRPLRWVQSRGENLVGMQSRGTRFDVTVRATGDGRITALDVDALGDLGAYPGIGLAVLLTTRKLATGPYVIPRLRFRLRGVATNAAPTVPFRGAGRPEATAYLERAMDALARRLDLDPVEIRRRNFVPSSEFPYQTLLGQTYDSGDYGLTLDRALELADYDSLRAEQRHRRETGDRVLLGIGISSYVELSASGAGVNQEYGSVEVLPKGRVRIKVGTSAHGQGHRTTFSQIVSDVMGVGIEDIEFIQSDTDLVPRGIGTAGSRSAQVGGSALQKAAEAVVEQARELAAIRLEAPVEDIVLIPGAGFGVRGVPASSLSWQELSATPAGWDSNGSGTHRLFADPGFVQSEAGTAPFGCHLVVAEVDSETGAVRLRRVVAVDDCGVVLNPLLATGQVHGGVASGISEVLYEEFGYDGAGNPLTSTLAEYAFPSAAELPSFETSHTVTPSPFNPLGAKGLGEAGTTGIVPAAHNAVIDALAHLGVEDIDIPLTAEKVWRALEDARGGVTT